MHIMMIAGEICTARTQVQLLRGIRKTLPEFFGFESVGILIRDMKTDQMFTLNELKNDDHEEWMRQHAVDYDTTKALKEPMRDTEKIIIPHGLGISGHAFKSHQIIICNNMLQARGFQGDIDNQTDVVDVKNFMIAPIYGFK